MINLKQSSLVFWNFYLDVWAFFCQNDESKTMKKINSDSLNLNCKYDIHLAVLIFS